MPSKRGDPGSKKNDKNFSAIVNDAELYKGPEPAVPPLVEIVGRVRKRDRDNGFLVLIAGGAGVDFAVEVSTADVKDFEVAFEDSAGRKTYKLRVVATAQVKVLQTAMELAGAAAAPSAATARAATAAAAKPF